MTNDERDYFRQRAEAEIQAALAARHPDAARAHYLLAGYYLDLAYNPDAPPPPWAGDPTGPERPSGAPVTGGVAFA